MIQRKRNRGFTIGQNPSKADSDRGTRVAHRREIFENEISPEGMMRGALSFIDVAIDSVFWLSWRAWFTEFRSLLQIQRWARVGFFFGCNAVWRSRSTPTSGIHRGRMSDNRQHRQIAHAV